MNILSFYIEKITDLSILKNIHKKIEITMIYPHSNISNNFRYFAYMNDFILYILSIDNESIVFSMPIIAQGNDLPLIIEKDTHEIKYQLLWNADDTMIVIVSSIGDIYFIAFSLLSCALLGQYHLHEPIDHGYPLWCSEKQFSYNFILAYYQDRYLHVNLFDLSLIPEDGQLSANCMKFRLNLLSEEEEDIIGKI